MLRCPKCGEILRFQVSVFVEFSASAYRAVTKAEIAKSTSKILGVDWPNLRRMFCPGNHGGAYTLEELARHPHAHAQRKRKSGGRAGGRGSAGDRERRGK